jgi:hypothetical protein
MLMRRRPGAPTIQYWKGVVVRFESSARIIGRLHATQSSRIPFGAS